MSTEHDRSDERSHDADDAGLAAAHSGDPRTEALEGIWDDLEQLARRVDDEADAAVEDPRDARRRDTPA